tara:strand:- start:140 stop:481 length:342 start_codon:yes stop_codon:yes gene_type:complete
MVLVAGTVMLGQRQTTFEALAVSTSAVGITNATLRPPGQTFQNNFCTAYVSGANVRFRFDGTAPTTSVGAVASDGDTISIDNLEQASAVQFIRDDAVDATLEIHCWRQPVTGA